MTIKVEIRLCESGETRDKTLIETTLRFDKLDLITARSLVGQTLGALIIEENRASIPPPVTVYGVKMFTVAPDDEQNVLTALMNLAELSEDKARDAIGHTPCLVAVNLTKDKADTLREALERYHTGAEILERQL